VSIHVSKTMGSLRRVVLSCDVAGCPVQLEPEAAEQWRSDPDARSWAREHAPGWIHDPVGQTDYCPAHAQSSVGRVTGVVPPQPTATARDQSGNPLNRDAYAAQLRAQLTDGGRAMEDSQVLTFAEATVVARLLEELAGVYRGESLGALAHELATRLDRHIVG
jgi:hypothetical protein